MTDVLATLPKLDLGRRLDVRADWPEQLDALRQGWQAEGVRHGEVLVALTPGAEALASLHAAARLLETTDCAARVVVHVQLQAPWPELAAHAAAWPWLVGLVLAPSAALPVMARDEAEDLRTPGMPQPRWHRGLLLDASAGVDLLELVRPQRALWPGELPLGADVLAWLRAHRVPLLVPASRPDALGTLTRAGVTTLTGSAWPAMGGPTLTQTLQTLAQRVPWRLDDLRALMMRHVEAAVLAPAERQQLARQVEAWRHRPHTRPLGRDGFSF